MKLQKGGIHFAKLDRDIESCANRLAELEKERQQLRDEINTISTPYNEKIWFLEDERDRELGDLLDHGVIVDDQIRDLKKSIVGLWDDAYSETKMEFPCGTLSFRINSRLDVRRPFWLFQELVKHLPTHVIVEQYMHGFKEGKVRTFLAVHPVSVSVVRLVNEVVDVALEVDD